MRKVITYLSSAAALFLLTASLAQGGTLYQNPVTYGGIKTIPELLIALVNLIFLIGVPIIVIFIIYAGFLFVKSGDNESELAKAKNVLMWTLIGALILLGAKAIGMAICNTVLSLGTTPSTCSWI